MNIWILVSSHKREERQQQEQRLFTFEQEMVEQAVWQHTNSVWTDKMTWHCLRTSTLDLTGGAKVASRYCYQEVWMKETDNYQLDLKFKRNSEKNTVGWGNTWMQPGKWDDVIRLVKSKNLGSAPIVHPCGCQFDHQLLHIWSSFLLIYLQKQW